MNSTESTTAICPVMGSSINKEVAEEKGLVREVDGQKYYLCCEACIPLFEADPVKYIQGTTAPTPNEHGHEHHS